MSDPKPRFGSLWPVSANAMTVPDGCSAGVDGALWSGSFASLPIDRALSSRHDRPPGLARMNVAVAPQPGVTALGVGVLLPHAPVTIACDVPHRQPERADEPRIARNARDVLRDLEVVVILVPRDAADRRLHREALLDRLHRRDDARIGRGQ